MYTSVMKGTLGLSGNHVFPYLKNHFAIVDSFHKVIVREIFKYFFKYLYSLFVTITK